MLYNNQLIKVKPPIYRDLKALFFSIGKSNNLRQK